MYYYADIVGFVFCRYLVDDNFRSLSCSGPILVIRLVLYYSFVMF